MQFSPFLQCTHDRVTPLTEMQCGGRSHAFRLDFVAQGGGGHSQRYKVLLSADTAADYATWTTRIDETLHNISIWQPKHMRH